MGQRLAIIGFALAVILAIFLFTQQQDALKAAQLAQTAQADMDDRSGTAVAQAIAAGTSQAQSESERLTAVALAQNAATAQAVLDAQRGTAVAEAKSADTRSNDVAATATLQAEMIGAAQATLEALSNQQATLAAQSTAALSTAQAQIDAQATTQTGYNAAVGTATAQVDLAEFARQAAEEDRATALANFWVASTIVAQQSDVQATAQANGNGATPAPTIAAATLAPTQAIEPTALPTAAGATDTIPPLTGSYTTNDTKLTFNYPEGWIAGEGGQGVILIANQQAILQRSSNDLQSGDFVIQMQVEPISTLSGLSAGATALDVTKVIHDAYQSQNTPDLTDPITLTLGETNAERFTATEGNNALVVTVVDLGNDIVALAFSYTFPGEMDKFIQTLDDILSSLKYQA